MSKGNAKVASGCFLMTWQLLLTAPLWFFIVYSLLKVANPPEIVWYAFYVYVPASVIGIILSGMFGAANAHD